MWCLDSRASWKYFFNFGLARILYNIIMYNRGYSCNYLLMYYSIYILNIIIFVTTVRVRGLEVNENK